MTAPVQVGPPPQGGGLCPWMTPCLLDVLQLAANGHSNKAIGLQRHTTEETVKSQMAKIMRRLHVGDRTQAVAVGIALGLIRTDQITIPRHLARVEVAEA